MSQHCRVLMFMPVLCALIAVVMLISWSSIQNSYYECRLGNINVWKEMTIGRGLDFMSPAVDFSVQESLTLPFPSATQPVEDLLQQNWVRDLHQIIAQIPQNSTPIFTVTCNSEYQDVLLNWLIAAKTQVNPPITNIVILSLDKELYVLLVSRNIQCVLVEPSSYIKRALLDEGMEVFYQILVLRLTAIRLINHWGYDAANVDTDAVVLRNPEPLFSMYRDSDMIASYGKFPYNLKAKWGATMCGGMFLIRSSTSSEKFWKVMSSTLPMKLNDQVKLNSALNAMHPDWGDTRNKDILYDVWTAITPDGFKVAILPSKYVCRQKCDIQKRDQYYVWHKGGSRSTDGKMVYAQQGRLWFLRKDWERTSRNSTSMGDDWLREITERVEQS